jgi:hypothetical protein
MADLGAVARPNGRIVTAMYVVKFPLLWQTTGRLGAISNGFKVNSFFAYYSALVWQKSGQGNASFGADPNGRGAAAQFYIPWYTFLVVNGSLVAQKAYNCNGSIYGKVTISAIRQKNARVWLIDGGELGHVGMQFTNSLGEYRFDGLPKEYTNFTILVDDPTGQYNQGRLDNLTPV